MRRPSVLLTSVISTRSPTWTRSDRCRWICVPSRERAPAAAPVLTYRADLDGLRAVAVLLVLFYHVGFSWCGGGYVGVDVFFVLTGFLITSLLIHALERGQLSFGYFYLRRMRRILPALATMVLVTCAVSFFVLMPQDLLRLLDSARYTLLSAGNFYF